MNSSPEKVRDPKFLANEFFDPRDLVQVKYEMLRRVSVENVPVTEATEDYGVSRPTFYQAQEKFAEAGIAGPGSEEARPPRPPQTSGRGMEVRREASRVGRADSSRQLAALIRQKFDLEIHPRTIERTLARKKTAS